MHACALDLEVQRFPLTAPLLYYSSNPNLCPNVYHAPLIPWQRSTEPVPVGAKARSAVAVLRAVYPGVWVYLGSRYTGPARLVMFSRALCVQAQATTPPPSPSAVIPPPRSLLLAQELAELDSSQRAIKRIGKQVVLKTPKRTEL